MNKRVQHSGGTATGQIKVLWWWITVKTFPRMSDAVKWLGYGKEET